jgi:hypothetical protein
MKYYLIAEPVGDTTEPVWKIYSEDAIIAEYWDTWQRQGDAYNKANGFAKYTGITAGRCIEDWLVIHWAVEATHENLLKIISAPKGP